MLRIRKKLGYIACYTFIIILILAGIIYLLLNSHFFTIINVEIPVINIASSLGAFGKYVYGLSILIAIFTTAVSSGYSFLVNVTKSKGSYLKLGQGLPISYGLDSGTDIEVKFKYTIGRLANTPNTDSTKRGIIVNFRKKDFLTGDLDDNNSYFDIEMGNNSGRSKNFSLSESDASKEVTLRLSNIKSGDEMWFKVCPETTDGGYYVKLSDLKVTSMSN